MAWRMLNLSNLSLFPLKHLDEKQIESYYNLHSSKSNRAFEFLPQSISDPGIPSDAYALLAANRLRLPLLYRLSDSDTVVVKSVCHAEMKNAYYDVCLKFHELEPILGSCQCVAGQSGPLLCGQSGSLELFGACCKHVGALALALRHFLENKKYPDFISCTSKPCAWNVPAAPRGFQVPSVSSFSVRKPKDPCLFKPVRSKTYVPVSDTEIVDNAARKLAEWSFAKKTPASALLDPLASLVELPPIPILSEPVDSSYDPVLLIPRPIDHQYARFVADVIHLEMSQLSLEHFVHYQSFHCLTDQARAEEIFSLTREQSASTEWKELRKTLITASKIHQIVSRAKEFTKEFVGNLITDRFQTAQMHQGMMEEDSAVELYLREKRASGYADIKAIKAGLCISPSFPFIGASPDRITICGDSPSEVGVVEVKVLTVSERFQWDHIPERDSMSVEQLLCAYVAAKKSTTKSFVFYLKEDSDGWSLKRSHAYYSQIITQLAVSGLPFCDFVVKVDQKVFVERIKFIPAEFFCERFFVKVSSFFFRHFLPFHHTVNALAVENE